MTILNERSLATMCHRTNWLIAVQLHLVAKYLMIHEKIDGVNFEKLMNGEITESDFMPESNDSNVTNDSEE